MPSHSVNRSSITAAKYPPSAAKEPSVTDSPSPYTRPSHESCPFANSRKLHLPPETTSSRVKAPYANGASCLARPALNHTGLDRGACGDCIMIAITRPSVRPQRYYSSCQIGLATASLPLHFHCHPRRIDGVDETACTAALAFAEIGLIRRRHWPLLLLTDD